MNERAVSGVKSGYAKKKARRGYGFLAPWLIGTPVFFLFPLLRSLAFCFMDNTALKPASGGMTAAFLPLENGEFLRNFRDVFTADPNFKDELLGVLRDTLISTPLILIFSLFIAVLLDKKFKGNAFFRAIFFLPVIIVSGPVYSIISGNMESTGASGGFSTLFETDLADRVLKFLGLMEETGEGALINAAADNIFGLIWCCGIQILIFLSALETVPKQGKEAAMLEGASGWEIFWRVTLPQIAPMVTVALIFTVIDSFTRTDNAVMRHVITRLREWDYAYSAAMVWSYFAIVLAALGAAVALTRHFLEGRRKA